MSGPDHAVHKSQGNKCSSALHSLSQTQAALGLDHNPSMPCRQARLHLLNTKLWRQCTLTLLGFLSRLSSTLLPLPSSGLLRECMSATAGRLPSTVAAVVAAPAAALVAAAAAG